ncbi:MAG: lipid-A-disaccharide synthase [Candidatus Rokuibacteriota bacterium]
MAPGEGAPVIMLAVGEASGDLHGALLCRALRAAAPGCRLVGMGGPRMRAEGMEVAVDLTGAAAVGGTEAVGRVPALVRAYRTLRAMLAGAAPPSALVLVDFPEFNLRLATAARRAGVPVVYFIPPQIWAWRPWRIRALRRLTSLVLAVLPFEHALYRRAGVRVEFVGHPVLDALASAPGREQARRELGLAAAVPVIGLLPGSRREEVERLLPAMRAAAARVAAARPGARFVLALAPTIERATVDRLVEGSGASIEVVPGRTHAVMRAADLLLIASGTATLEAALLGTPMVVCYRLSWLSEAMVRLLVRVPWMSLANITLGRAVVPELYRDTSGETLAAAALRLLDTPGALQAQRDAFAELTGQLGEPGVCDRAARLILHVAHADHPGVVR